MSKRSEAVARAAALVEEALKLSFELYGSEDARRRGRSKVDLAIELCSEAISVCPTYAEAHAVRACLRAHERHDRAGAQTDAMEAYRLRPVDPHTYWQLAFLVADPAMKRRILRAGMRRAGRAHPSYDELWFLLAQSHWYEGHFRQQAAELERLRKTLGKEGSPAASAERIAFFQSIAYQALGRYDLAERVERAAGTPTVWLVQLRAGDAPGAIRTLDHASAGDAARPGGTQLTADRAFAGVLAGEDLPPEAIEAVARTATDQLEAGVLFWHIGLCEAGRPRLAAYIRTRESNPREWGITCRWEISLARRLLAGEPSVEAAKAASRECARVARVP